MAVRTHKGGWLGGLTAAHLLLLGALLAVETVIAERQWWAIPLTYGPQHLAPLPGALLALAALLRGRPRLVLWNLGGVIAALVLLLGVTVPVGRAPAGGQTLRVMTYNVHHCGYTPAGVARVAAAIRQQHPDLVLLQELAPPGQPQVEARLYTAFPGWSRAGVGDVGLLSRFPIRAKRIHTIPRMRRPFLEVELDVRGRRLTVFVVHLQTAFHRASLLHHHGTVRQYLADTAEVRALQAAALLRAADARQGPVLLGGDFNTPPRGHIYRRLTRRYRDAFAAAGWGDGATYPAHLPLALVRIDHLLLGDGLAARRAWVPRTPASDHRPMVAEIVW